jgi:hypothetical protein
MDRSRYMDPAVVSPVASAPTSATTILVCARCGEDWDRVGSPAICVHCGMVSYPVVVATTEDWQDIVKVLRPEKFVGWQPQIHGVVGYIREQLAMTRQLQLQVVPS